jgi:RHS repeat-associated protein
MHVGTAENGVLTGITTNNQQTELKHGGQVLGTSTSFGLGIVAPNNSDERFMFAMLERVPSAKEVMLARRRTYDPTTGRFFEPDPIGAAGGLQLYQYAHNDPRTFVDPMGMAAIGADCSEPGSPPVIHIDPIRPQTYEALGMNAPQSVFDVIAGSSLGQMAYLTSLAEGAKGILNSDAKWQSKYGGGPLCVVNCSTAQDSSPAEKITYYNKEEITIVRGGILGRLFGRLFGGGGKKGGGGGVVGGDCDDCEPDNFSTRGSKTTDPKDLLADAFAELQHKWSLLTSAGMDSVADRATQAAKHHFSREKITERVESTLPLVAPWATGVGNTSKFVRDPIGYVKGVENDLASVVVNVLILKQNATTALYSLPSLVSETLAVENKSDAEIAMGHQFEFGNDIFKFGAAAATVPLIEFGGVGLAVTPGAGAFSAQARAAELQASRRIYEVENGTTAVIRGQHRVTGEVRSFVATDMPIQPRQFGSLKAGEEFVEGVGHAEQTIIRERGADWDLFEGGSSRNVCIETCKPLIEEAGMTLGGLGFFGKPDKTPFRMFWKD